MLIGISGKKRSGKDTLGSYLIENHGFRRISFADKLKDIVARDYDFPREWFDLDDKKDAPIPEFYPTDACIKKIGAATFAQVKQPSGLYRLYHTPRTLAIIEGGNKREIDPLYWVKAALRDVDIVNDNICLTDVRFKNEANHVLSLGGHLVRVEREGIPRIEHLSETDLDLFSFDNKIHNNASLDSLYNVMENVLQSIKERK